MKKVLYIVCNIAIFCVVAKATPDCSQGHCARISDTLNKYCINIGMAGKPFMVIGPNGECFCPCSCVVPETEIDLVNSLSRIDDLDHKETLLTPVSKNKFGVLDKKMRSEITNGRLISVTFENGSTIKASENHTFITPQETIIAADELQLGQYLLDKHGKQVRLVDKSYIENYTGGLLNVIVNESSSLGENHVISNNGMLSGDWLLQTHNDSVEAGISIRSGNINIYWE